MIHRFLFSHRTRTSLSRSHSPALTLPLSLRSFARYSRSHSAHLSPTAQELLKGMTSEMRGEASLVAATTIFEQVPYLSHPEIHSDFLSLAALSLTPAFHCPREEIPSTSLCVVERGLVARDGRCGVTVFGEDMILDAVPLRDPAPAFALTLVQLQCLSRQSLDGLLSQPPFASARAVVRKARIKLTMCRVVLRVAEYARKEAAKVQNSAAAGGEKDGGGGEGGGGEGGGGDGGGGEGGGGAGGCGGDGGSGQSGVTTFE